MGAAGASALPALHKMLDDPNDSVREAAKNGETPNRGRYCHIPVEKRSRIHEMLEKDFKPDEIAADVRCSIQTVYRERNKKASNSATTSSS